jgi:uncharacterized protein YyaL (SSP411 family)
MNRLAHEKSAYLKHAAHQRIDWYAWSEEAFEKAHREDKPVFLSTGAIWCHWCHVMAQESFENEEIIKLLNDNFVNVKLDRDERPDIDRIYQNAVAAMGAGGGWPLSVFLTHDKMPFYGGTYFPPEDLYGRPGFKKVLKAVLELFTSKKEEISHYTGKLINALKPKPMDLEDLKESEVGKAVEKILSELDPQNGGFGTAPKFPMTGALEFLINRYVLTSKESIRHAVKKTLESMAKGGFHDQIQGGFHRYSTDEAWIIPHFEKMADDNAWLLRNYIDAYAIFGDEYFKDVATGIINFIQEVLSDTDGGFYASQDADVTPDDEGGYFTWTDEDFRKVMSDEEYRILSLYLFHEKGTMHHDGAKRVLFVSLEKNEIAQKTGIDIHKVNEIIARGKKKLLRERKKRKMPFVDKTLYTSLNGMLITAYLKAFRILKDKQIKDYALKSLHRIMKKYFIENELFHSEGVKAFLDDYINFGEALVSAYEVTGDPSYLRKADDVMELCIRKLWDSNEGGFFETETQLIGIRLKGIEDISHPSANALSIRLLLKLYHLTGKDTFYQYAEKALKAFSARAKNQHILTGYYYSALDAYFNMLTLTLHTTKRELIDMALSMFSPYTNIVYGEDKGFVLPCLGTVCYEPIDNPEALKEFLKKRRQKSNE